MKKWTIALIVVISLIVFPGCATVGTLFGGAAYSPPEKEVEATAVPVSHVTETGTFSQGQVLDELQTRLAEIYADVNPSVVSIQVMTAADVGPYMFQSPFEDNPDSEVPELLQEGAGSGFVWNTEGYIVTNNHVVADAQKITVRFYDGTQVAAELVGADADSDLAVIKVDVPASRLQPAVIGDSTKVAVGQIVVAIGNPFGLENTMTVGFVSALERSLPVEGISGGFTIPEVIQTDAPINPGNSGGVLLNDDGQVIGVTSAIISPVEASAGIGFAIPSSMVSKVIPALLDGGAYSHAWLGISGTSLTPDLAQAMGLDADQRGALVIEVVEDGPSEAAGLQSSTQIVTIDSYEQPVGGDVIIAFDDITINDFDDLVAVLGHYSAGQQVTLTVMRGGREMQVNITLGERPD